MYKCRAPKNQAELAQYYQLRWQTLRQPSQQPMGSEKDDLEAQSYHRVIVDDMDNIVGAGRLHNTSQEQAQIRYMAISEHVRGQGLGKVLVNELERTAAKAGVKTIELNARVDAIGFYQRLGYSNEGYSHTLFGVVKHNKMIKSIIKSDNHLAELADNLQQLWHQTIPLSKAMNINICYFDQQKLLTNCEPNFNKNLHNTMFAGSIYTLATLTGWAWVYLALQAQQADIVLAQGNIRYIAPLLGIAYAQTSLNLVTGSVEPLLHGKNARFNIEVEVCCGDSVVALFTGAYVAMAKRK
ncbi:bifunctional GNAT family N-acetyltransferase/hotdog fold thioesterase [Colwellia sp. C1TZA3]|uniref:bifunctional GNAT family N-acetyltransferase/hotdog fold thioesterase n=1 Tax=Colwellia sp. C1TZA3 TaxID=2508879 RepID=UPI0011BA01CE|nr:bifunctional GNAT family N-acetyltransferase/hotdog fold thioesterase [Colwellia sp. C1TZA3]TWX72987.1 GNAT family N-acetyltransferase [Colwellia sp. C1TZA3]